jgi:hypothetical protein
LPSHLTALWLRGSWPSWFERLRTGSALDRSKRATRLLVFRSTSPAQEASVAA